MAVIAQKDRAPIFMLTALGIIIVAMVASTKVNIGELLGLAGAGDAPATGGDCDPNSLMKARLRIDGIDHNIQQIEAFKLANRFSPDALSDADKSLDILRRERTQLQNRYGFCPPGTDH